MKAEEDFAVVQTLARKRHPSFNNAICFHAQQCAEKYLKALLTHHRVVFPKTHDLLELLDLVKRHHATIELLRPHLEYLVPYAVNLRYPGEFATRTEATRSARTIAKLRVSLRQFLDLP
ncbi:MAG: HEPN domain-containing protein [Candidatus Omnitrophica bacterium]|nr:HEPN domain-containing protein [Candidatus Omnitrophota bacterium]